MAGWRGVHGAAVVFTAVVVLAGCGSGSSPSSDGSTAASAPTTTGTEAPNEVAGVAIPDGQVDRAVGQLDDLAGKLLSSSGIPGMAVAVVHNGKVLYHKGFGVRNVDTRTPVDDRTVFQLASVSKSVGATVVAHQVGTGGVGWDTPIRRLTPGFALSDPYVSDHVTVGDLYAHRSGLPDHAGDLLEDLGYDRAQVLERLRQLPLGPFRDSYEYTNFGLTAAAVAVATAAGTDWETLSQQALYGPLGMADTSSRYADFAARTDRADGHVRTASGFRPADPPRQPDAQSPAGGVSSSVTDMATWMTMVLGGGVAGNTRIAPSEALLPALSPQSVSSPPHDPAARAGFYGFGFNVSDSASGRVTLGHSGAFDLGAATAFSLIPSAGVGIVTLTNGPPEGVPEALNAEFADLVQFGAIRQDWTALYHAALAPLNDAEGALAGTATPANPVPAQPLPGYAGTYANGYYGPATVAVTGTGLTLTLGPKNMTFPLRHWNGNVFVFTPPGENAPPGTLSQATFDGNRLVLEFYDKDHLGTFLRG